MEWDQWYMTLNIHIDNFYDDTKVQFILQKGEKCNYRKVEESCAMRMIEGPKCADYCLVQTELGVEKYKEKGNNLVFLGMEARESPWKQDFINLFIIYPCVIF